MIRIARGARIVALAITAAALGSAFTATAAQADPAPAISVVDGATAPVFDYTSAIRERVYIPVPGVDQDLDGHDDVTVADIIRPAESDQGLKVPAIIDPSPYYTTIGRGNESEKIADLDGDGINDVWPTYYDNYFVPRGYAVVLAHANGTGFSTGCPMHGGPGDIASMKVVVDWLQGRAAAHDAAGHTVTAGWHNGKAAMIGKSYDGTLTNGVAATGVQGLTTIVPIDAITDWYSYSRTGGIRHDGFNYPSSLSAAVTNPDRRTLCEPTRNLLNAMDGDETGDINAFWQARDYLPDAQNITASVFAVHGLNDDNVAMDQLGDYWAALTAHNVPRKLWLAKTGHVDPFDYRRAVWVDTLHRWFDYWLQGIDNGIMDDPMATVENGPGDFEDYANWPLPGTSDVDVYLAGTTAGAAGSLLLEPDDALATSSFTSPSITSNEATLMASPEGSQANRLVFLSQPLATDLRLSGTPRIELTASLDQPQSNLTAILVDYGPSTRTPRDNEGIQNTTTRTCWGDASDDDDACYLEVVHRSVSTDVWRVSRGVLDSSNRDSLIDGEATPVVPGTDYHFDWPLEPYDQVFPAGHRIGVVVATKLRGYSVPSPSLTPTVTVDTTVSRIVLPIVGGLPAAAAAVGLGAVAPVTLAFDLGGHGTAIPDQTVAYATAPAAPTTPEEAGWVFTGWYSDVARTVPFDFGATMTADATAYAGWTDLLDVLDTLKIVPSDTNPQQGDTITVVVTAFDPDGHPLGDVTGLADITSSVQSDVIVGDSITFRHASPHLITATLGTVSASVSVSVRPAASGTTGGSSEPADLALTGVGPDLTGALAMAGLLAAAGAALVVVRRGTRARRRSATRRA
jgi:X-Pro dipeptidyl-peptidase